MKTITEIKSYLANGGNTCDAISMLSDIINADSTNEEAFIERGLLHWGGGNRAAAINDYLAAIAINPESKARQALQATNDILDYYNKDLYNP